MVVLLLPGGSGTALIESSLIHLVSGGTQTKIARNSQDLWG